MSDVIKVISIEENYMQEILHNSLHTIISQAKPQFFLEDEVLTKEEAAAFMKVSVSTVNNWLSSGKLSPHRPGSDPRFIKSELFEFVKAS